MVSKKLIETIEEKKYDLFIAHFSGIDHIGHSKHDPNSEKITEILHKISKMISDLV